MIQTSSSAAGLSVEGRYGVRDFLKVEYLAQRRLLGWRHALGGLTIIVLTDFGFLVGCFTSPNDLLLAVAGLAVLLLAVLYGFGFVNTANYLRLQKLRGGQAIWPVRLTINAEGLEVVREESSATFYWPAMTRLVRQGKVWLLIGGGVSHIIPSALFADAAAERAFIGQILQRLPPAAQAASPQAAKLVSGGEAA